MYYPFLLTYLSTFVVGMSYVVIFISDANANVNANTDVDAGADDTRV